MPRQARIDAPEALHHIIRRGIEGRNIFKNNTDFDPERIVTRNFNPVPLFPQFFVQPHFSSFKPSDNESSQNSLNSAT